MKNRIIAFLTLLVISISFAGCAATHIGQAPAPAAMQTEAPASDGFTVQIPADSVNGITESEAVALCYEVLGEKAEETGYRLKYNCVGAIEAIGKQYYYIMNVAWLVEENHWSHIGEVMVSANGDAIYDGVSENGNYFLGGKRWQK